MHPPSDPAPHAPTGWRWRAYRLVRPVVRPVAWRLRTFFTGRLHDDVAELRAEIRALRQELRARDAAHVPAVDARIEAVIGQALLTLALDREGS